MGAVQRGLSIRVQGPPFCSAFCGLAFRPLLVLQAIFVEIEREFPAIAEGSRANFRGPQLLWNFPG